MLSSKTKETIHIAVPLPLLKEKYLSVIIKEKLSIEVGFDHGTLDFYSLKDIQKIAKELLKGGIKCSVHASFCDLSLGAFDSLIRKATLQRLKESLQGARFFSPSVIVLHTGYHPAYHQERLKDWQKLVKEGLNKLLELASLLNIRLAIENVLEPDPEYLTEIVEAVDSPFLGYCFDPGHALGFVQSPWKPWLKAFAHRLFELHIHNNYGQWDEHLPPQKGKIPFPEIFSFLKKENISPILTYEAHREEDVFPGLLYLQELLAKI